MFRKWKEGKKGNQEYAKIVQEQVELSRQEAEKDNVKVPSLSYILKPQDMFVCLFRID